MNNGIPIYSILSVLCVSMIACGNGGEKGSLLLYTGAQSTTDASGVLYQITCTTSFADGGPLPDGGTTEYIEQFVPFNEGAAPPWLLPDGGGDEHSFADLFEFVEAPAVCTIVVTVGSQDATGEFTPLERCEREVIEVVVPEGATIEEVVIIDCRGDDDGGIDIPVIINECPVITDVVIDNKFPCEGDTIPISIEVEDPDGDLVTCTWEVTQWPSGVDPASFNLTPQMTTDLTGHEVTFTGNELGPYQVVVTCSDDVGDCATTFTFPLHVIECGCDCPEGYDPVPTDDSCVRYETVEVQSSSTVYTVCEGDNNRNYSFRGARLPGGTMASPNDVPDPNDYWGAGVWAPTIDPLARLNLVGVWACDPTSVDTGDPFPMTNPVNEWIGFSVCLDVDEAGDYMVGLGADNQLRLSLNGNVLFEKLGNDPENFRNWWMYQLTLNAGKNIVELLGKNNGQVAAFGAEFAGPYPAGDLATDLAMINADFTGNMIFSTLDVIGQTFEVGEASGYVCPDGYALDTCEPETVCTRRLESPCL